MTIDQARCPELEKLKTWLDGQGIKYTCPDTDDDPFSIARVHFSIRKTRYSVIHGYGTYGGEYCYDADRGLLELMVGEKDPVGYLTAEEVIEIVNTEIGRKCKK